MKAKIRRLVKNPRYRMLQIGDSHYLMDFGGQFWKIIFPFFTWIFPNYIYKVDDEEVVKRLKAPLKEEAEGPGALFAGGLGVLLPNLTGSLVDYFDLSMPFWFNVVLLVTALVSVVFLFLAFSRKYKKRLQHTLQLELLLRYKIWLRPKSFVHVFNLFVSYELFLVGSVFCYIVYVSNQNVFVLFTASLIIFFVFIFSLYTGEEGTTTVTFKENNENVG